MLAVCSAAEANGAGEKSLVACIGCSGAEGSAERFWGIKPGRRGRDGDGIISSFQIRNKARHLMTCRMLRVGCGVGGMVGKHQEMICLPHARFFSSINSK